MAPHAAQPWQWAKVGAQVNELHHHEQCVPAVMAVQVAQPLQCWAPHV